MSTLWFRFFARLPVGACHVEDMDPAAFSLGRLLLRKQLFQNAIVPQEILAFSRQPQSPPIMSSARNLDKPRILEARQPRVGNAGASHNPSWSPVRISRYGLQNRSREFQEPMLHFSVPLDSEAFSTGAESRRTFLTGRFMEDAAHVQSVNAHALSRAEALAFKNLSSLRLV